MRRVAVLMVALAACWPHGAAAQDDEAPLDPRVEIQEVLNHLHLAAGDASWQARLDALPEPARLAAMALQQVFYADGAPDQVNGLLDAAQDLALAQWATAAAEHAEQAAPTGAQIAAYLDWAGQVAPSLQVGTARRALGVLRIIDAATRWSVVSKYHADNLVTWSTLRPSALSLVPHLATDDFILRLPCRLLDQEGADLLMSFLTEVPGEIGPVIASPFDCAMERFGLAHRPAELLSVVANVAESWNPFACGRIAADTIRTVRTGDPWVTLANIFPADALHLAQSEPYANPLASATGSSFTFRNPAAEIAWPETIAGLAATYREIDGLAPEAADLLARWAMARALPQGCEPPTDPDSLPAWQRFSLPPSLIDSETLVALAASLTDTEAEQALGAMLRHDVSAEHWPAQHAADTLPSMQPVAVLEALIAHHPDLLGKAALTRALARHPILLERYLALGVPIDAPPGEKPPLLAADGGRAAEMLIRAGADLEAEFEGKTPAQRLLSLLPGHESAIDTALWREIAARYPQALNRRAINWMLVEDALDLLPDDPVSAAALLDGVADTRARVTLALVLHVFGDRTIENQRRIARLLWLLYRHFELGRSDEPWLWQDYTGTTNSLQNALAALSVGGDPLEIDCVFLRADPGLLDAMEARTGGPGANSTARARCEGAYALPASVEALVQMMWEPAFNPFSTGPGSRNFGISAGLRKRMATMQAAPDRLPPFDADWPPDAPLYEAWAMLGLWNHAAADRLQPAYQLARTDLAAHYVSLFDVDPEVAEAWAIRALRAMRSGNGPLDEASRRTLRYMIMNGAPTEAIEELLATLGSVNEAAEPELSLFSPYQAGRPEPLANVTVLRPDVLEMLLAKGLDPGATNGFGKTALMTAAQLDAVESAALLVRAGVDVGAVTRVSNRRHLPLDHDHRTALHYAAASGSLAMIRLLLEAGADPLVPDSKGLRPIHYLLGEGPVPPNPKLDEAAMLEAIALLR